MPIRELPKSVSSKIAAGEVVERPVSVVKELIENSIDAGAREIKIFIKDAGRTLIEVDDNGEGIHSSDAALAVRRYATSKISNVEDLANIHTLGFRGEALASIAAVSQFLLETRHEEELEGVSLQLEGGERISVKAIAKQPGTKVRVKNLFFNLPARQKFLKKDVTEKRLITELVTRYAFYYSQIRFNLVIDNRRVLTTFGRGNRREILSEAYGLEAAKLLLEIKHEDSRMAIEGFVSPTNLTRTNRKEIFFFVNGRLVVDSTLTSAVLNAYHGFLMVGRFPIAMLFISVQPDDVDVNVHPTKAEIRFKDTAKMFSAVHSVVRKTISAFSPVPPFSPDIWRSSVTVNHTLHPAWQFAHQQILQERRSSEEKTQNVDQSPLIEKVPLLRVIGQLGRMYIAAEGPDGLYLIDQHSAHERILFEKMVEEMNGRIVSQMLLEPRVIHLNASLMEAFEAQKETLLSIGFKIEPFGVDSIKVEAIPSVIQHLDVGEAILAALERDDEDQNLIEQTIEKKIISRICKHAAIKGGQVLSMQEQEKLIRDLENCESPRTCPHGRPTMIYLSVDMLARQFGRLGSR